MLNGAIRNELSHLKIRHTNLERNQGWPKDTHRVFYPYVNSDWTINVAQRQRLITVLEKGFERVNKLKIAFEQNNITQLNQYQSLLAQYQSIHHASLERYNFRPANDLQQFKQNVIAQFLYDMGAITRVTALYRSGPGGLNYQLIEELSDIEQLDPHLQNYFFPEVVTYMDEFHGLVNEMRNVPILS